MLAQALVTASAVGVGVSIVGTHYQAKLHMRRAFLWFIVADCLLIGIQIYLHVWPQTVLLLVYFAMSIKGLRATLLNQELQERSLAMLTGTDPQTADNRAAVLAGRTDVIPRGDYCYRWSKDGTRKLCPYWALDPKRTEQSKGYCALLRRGDWEVEGFSLLFDQVKECEYNTTPNAPP